MRESSPNDLVEQEAAEIAEKWVDDSDRRSLETCRGRPDLRSPDQIGTEEEVTSPIGN